MTVAICTNCGEKKSGVLLPCPSCGARPSMSMTSFHLSDHYLTDAGLDEASRQVKEVRAGLRRKLELAKEHYR